MARSYLYRILPNSSFCLLIILLLLIVQPALGYNNNSAPVGLSLYPIPAGGNSLPVKCAVLIDTDIDSSKVKVGDIVRGTLKQSLLVSPTYNAAPGSIVIGKITGIAEKRTLAKSVISSDRRFSQDDTIDITFTDLYCPDRMHFAINGKLSKQKINIPLPNGHLRAIVVNKDGQLIHEHEVLKLKQKAGNWVGQYVIQAATVTSGIFTAGVGFVAVPLVMGVAGSISPPFVTNAPIDPDEKHPRLKGFGWGVVNAIPGSCVVEAFVCKGDDTEILPGLVMSVDFKPATATLAAACSVKGVVTQVAIQNPQLSGEPGTNLKMQYTKLDTGSDTEALTWPAPDEQVASVGSIH